MTNCMKKQKVSQFGFSLDPILTNIVLTELEKIVVSDRIRCDTKKFYKRYVDDTLLLVKPWDILQLWLNLTNLIWFIKFTSDPLPDGVIHFVDIKIPVDGTDVYRKDTHTSHYTYFSSFEHFSPRTAWIKSLFYRAFKICNTKKLFENQINTLKSFMSRNGYPNSIKKII